MIDNINVKRMASLVVWFIAKLNIQPVQLMRSHKCAFTLPVISGEHQITYRIVNKFSFF